jgi:hypothetical protein
MKISVFWNIAVVPSKSAFSEEHVASVIRIEEYAKQETSMKQLAGDIFHRNVG